MDKNMQDRLEDALLADRLEEALDVLVEAGEATVTVDALGEKSYAIADPELQAALGRWVAE